MKRPVLGVCRNSMIASSSATLLVAIGLACGDAPSDPGPVQTAPAPSDTVDTDVPESPAPSTPTPPATPASTDVPPVQPEEMPAETPAETPAAAESCDAFGSSDACAACVCDRCETELEACADTPGCPDILVCVRESGCSGRDCFCGDASLAECLRGEANGPCRDVTLAAPGGKAPTTQDTSAGPASDAALEVGDCAEDDDECADLCAIEAD